VNGLFTDRNFRLLFKQLEDGDIARLLETAGRDFETEKEEEDGEFLTLTMAGGEADKRLSLKENSSGEKKEGKALRSREREILKALRCYGRELVSSVDEDGITREAGLKEEGCRWRQDPELGWLFSGSEYACYSLRNREHLGSECGTFPFAQWNAMIGGIR